MSVIAGRIAGDVKTSGERIACVERTIESIFAVLIFCHVFTAIGRVAHVDCAADSIFAVVVLWMVDTSTASAEVQCTFVSVIAAIWTLFCTAWCHFVFTARHRVTGVGGADGPIITQGMTRGMLASVFWMTRVHSTRESIDTARVYRCV